MPKGLIDTFKSACCICFRGVAKGELGGGGGGGWARLVSTLWCALLVLVLVVVLVLVLVILTQQDKHTQRQKQANNPIAITRPCLQVAGHATELSGPDTSMRIAVVFPNAQRLVAHTIARAK